MNKNIRVEGFKYQFMFLASQFQNYYSKKLGLHWYDFLELLVFSHNKKKIFIEWNKAEKPMTVDIFNLKLYQRGDTSVGVNEQLELQTAYQTDQFKKHNQEFVMFYVNELIRYGGFISGEKNVQ